MFVVADVEDIEKVTRVTGAHLKPFVQDDPSSKDGGDKSDPRDDDPSSKDGGDKSDPRDDDPSSKDGGDKSDPRDDDPSSKDGGDKSDPRDDDPSSKDGGDNSDPRDDDGGNEDGDDEPPEKKRKVIGDQPWGASGLGLDEDDKDRLLSNKWLTDKHMHACSVLLKKAHPSQSGLHHTITLAKSPHRCASPADFVQIAHINQSHWVCISSINCPPGVVDVFDSSPYSSSTSKVLLKQAAGLAHCQEKQLEVRFVDVQSQNGADDCGVFAIAFATSLCIGVDPHLLSLNQDEMREHLINCFEEGEMLPFPPAATPRRFGRRRVKKVEKVRVYCNCRLPWDRHDTSLGSLAQCHRCKEWYHKDCARIPQNVFMDRFSVWCCSGCAVYI